MTILLTISFFDKNPKTHFYNGLSIGENGKTIRNEYTILLQNVAPCHRLNHAEPAPPPTSESLPLTGTMALPVKRRPPTSNDTANLARFAASEGGGDVEEPVTVDGAAPT